MKHRWACGILTKWTVAGHDPLWSLSLLLTLRYWCGNKCCLCHQLNHRGLSFPKLAAEAKYLRSLGQLLWSKCQAVGKAGFGTGRQPGFSGSTAGGVQCTKVGKQVFSKVVLKNQILFLRSKYQQGSCLTIPTLTQYQLKILVPARHCEQCFSGRLLWECRKIATPFEVPWEFTKSSVVSTEEEW